MRALLATLVLLSTCTPIPAEEAGLEGDEAGGETEAPLPELRRIGLIARGDYLFDGAAIGSEEALAPAHLVRVEPDAFVVMVEGSPHRSIARSAAWPMGCLVGPLEYTEGSLALRLDAGAPVYVLSASNEAARVSVALHSEHSIVIRRDRLRTDDCDPPAPRFGEGHVAEALAEGNVPCVFPDQETLDEGAGLPVPSGALATLEEDGDEWARVRVSLRGGTVEGWMGRELFATSARDAAPDWTGTVLAGARCVFPGRPEARPWEPVAGEEGETPLPTIPPIEIERVVRNGEIQIQACYQARLSAVPELTVELEVLMLVDADGHVERAQITRGASADEALSRCVIERVERWRFPPPRIGSVQVRRRFDLRPPPAPATEPATEPAPATEPTP